MLTSERQKSRLSSEARQADIVQILLTLAAQQSPADITTMAIAKAIGLTQGAVFRHFPTKEAIWLSALLYSRPAALAGYRPPPDDGH